MPGRGRRRAWASSGIPNKVSCGPSHDFFSHPGPQAAHDHGGGTGTQAPSRRPRRARGLTQPLARRTQCTSRAVSYLGNISVNLIFWDDARNRLLRLTESLSGLKPNVYYDTGAPQVSPQPLYHGSTNGGTLSDATSVNSRSLRFIRLLDECQSCHCGSK